MNNKKENLIECIVLFNGNFLNLFCKKEDIGKLDKLIGDVAGKKDEYVSFTDESGFIRRFNARAIIGWYFREILLNPTQQMIEFQREALNTLKAPPEFPGEDWKSEE